MNRVLLCLQTDDRIIICQIKDFALYREVYPSTNFMNGSQIHENDAMPKKRNVFLWFFSRLVFIFNDFYIDPNFQQISFQITYHHF